MMKRSTTAASRSRSFNTITQLVLKILIVATLIINIYLATSFVKVQYISSHDAPAKDPFSNIRELQKKHQHRSRGLGSEDQPKKYRITTNAANSRDKSASNKGFGAVAAQESSKSLKGHNTHKIVTSSTEKQPNLSKVQPEFAKIQVPVVEKIVDELAIDSATDSKAAEGQTTVKKEPTSELKQYEKWPAEAAIVSAPDDKPKGLTVLEDSKVTENNAVQNNVAENNAAENGGADNSVTEDASSTERRTTETTGKDSKIKAARIVSVKLTSNNQPGFASMNSHALPMGSNSGAATGFEVKPNVDPALATPNSNYTSDLYDPLRNVNFNLTDTKLYFYPVINYLGVLVDGGRHYYPIIWLKRLVDVMAKMNYNLMHLRLTDDQTFNLFLQSHPDLAYPTPFNNPNGLVYHPNELRMLVAYAKTKKVAIMPEVNMPGHAGSWAGISNLVLSCPGFTCNNGYGLPLNASYSKLEAVLTDVLAEVVDIFDDPPFLHLGGDELHMAENCFIEAGTPDIDAMSEQFEIVLKRVLKTIKFSEERVVRWEATVPTTIDRAGKIEHIWLPGTKEPNNKTFFVSAGLYCDINEYDKAYEIHKNTQFAINSVRIGERPVAVIVGAFELNPEWWHDRNVVGRMLAVAMAAVNKLLPKVEVGAKIQYVEEQYSKNCNALGLGPEICDSMGGVITPHEIYKAKWHVAWNQWKANICDRNAEGHMVKRMATSGVMSNRLRRANDQFWHEFGAQDNKAGPLLPLDTPIDSGSDVDKLKTRSVNYVGVKLDGTTSSGHLRHLYRMIRNYLGPLGLNWLQMQLISHTGYSYDNDFLVQYYAVDEGRKHSTFLNSYEVAQLAKSCRSVNIHFVPEINLVANATGWTGTGAMSQCPNALCEGKSVLPDIESSEFLPIVYTILSNLKRSANSTFFHLGSNERKLSKDCFVEDRIYKRKEDDIPYYNDLMDAFEFLVKSLLKAVNIPNEQTIRYNNIESDSYGERAGAITHYVADTDIITIKDPGSAFVSVNLLQGSAWDLYQNTYRLVQIKPLGIVADICTFAEERWTKHNIAGRLFTFKMATSNLPRYTTESAFNESYLALCSETKIPHICNVPTLIQSRRLCLSVDEAVDDQCSTHTVNAKAYRAKKALPFFQNVTIINEMKSLSSKSINDIFADIVVAPK